MRGANMGLRAIVAVMAMSAGFAPMAGMSKATSGNVRTANKEAIKHEVAPVQVLSRKQQLLGDPFGNQSNAGRFLNQRQYRKQCRQNPSLYKSKKHGSKN